MSKRAAEALLNAKKVELHSGAHLINGLGRRGATTVERMLDGYLEWYGNEYPSSIRPVTSWLNLHMVPEFGERYLEDISVYEIEQWKHRLLQTLSPTTVNHALKHFKCFARRCVTWKQASSFAFEDVKRLGETVQTLPKFLTPAQFSQLLAASPAPYKWIWQLMVNTGVRRGEALNLLWEDVSREAVQIESRDGAATKSRRRRTVGVNKEAWVALAALKLLYGGNKRVLPPELQPAAFSTTFARHRDAAGLPSELHLHSLRHSFACSLLMAGHDLTSVGKLLGHASLRSTQIYAGLVEDHVQSGVHKIGFK